MQEKIDQFTELRTRLDEFERQIQDALKKRMTSVLEAVQRYKDEVAELQSKQRVISEKFNKLQNEQEALEIERDTFKKDADDTKNKLEGYQIRKRQLEAQRAAVLEESSELDKMLETKEQEIRKQKEKMIKQRQRDNPEMKLYEKLLGMHIDASQPGTLHFEFRQFNDENMNRTCDITLDVSSDNFFIARSTPEIEDDGAKRKLMDTLNEQGDIATFLVKSRQMLISRDERQK